MGNIFDDVASLQLKFLEELIKIYEDSAELNFAISRKDMGVEKIHQDNNLVCNTCTHSCADHMVPLPSTSFCFYFLESGRSAHTRTHQCLHATSIPR